jgi:hypothetical protein
MTSSSVAVAWRLHDNDYPLQRDVNRLMRELNPTSVLIRRRRDGRTREELDVVNTAYKSGDGTVKFRPAVGGGRDRGHRNSVTHVSFDGSDTEVEVSTQQLHTREQTSRRLAREARAHLRKTLVQSERRLKLCKNGVNDPYSSEHTPLWDGNAARSASALAHATPRLRLGARGTATPGPGRSTLATHLPPLISALPLSPTSDLVPLEESVVEELPELTHELMDDEAALVENRSFFFTQPSFIASQAFKQLAAATPLHGPSAAKQRPSVLIKNSSDLDMVHPTSVNEESVMIPTEQTELELHVASAEAFRLRRMFKSVPAQVLMARDYRPPEPARRTELPELSSKLRSHPQFRMTMLLSSDKFYTSSKDTLGRKATEQKAKFDKKYRALDVGGAPLPFHATAAAILHHVDAVIHRDEHLSSRRDRHERRLEGLRELQTYLVQATHHPKVLKMLEFTRGYYAIDKPDPTPRAVLRDGYVRVG